MVGIAAALALAMPVYAQSLAIHGHPQKTTYASPAEWPVVDFQCHRAPQNVPETTIPTILGHVHRALQYPTQAVITPTTGVLTIPFQDKMFFWNGKILPGGQTHSIKNIVYDGPALVQEMQMVNGTMTLVTVQTVPGSGTDVPTIEDGDPNRLIIENGHLTIDPYGIDGNDLTSAWPPHGWAEVWSTLTAATNNGRYIGLQTQLTFWSELDPNAPITGNSEGGYPHTMVKCQNGQVVDGNFVSFGAVITDVNTPFPLEPITAPWPYGFFQYAYGGDPSASSLPNLARVSVDMNLHLGNEGTQLVDQVGVGDQPMAIFPDNPMWITPTMLGGEGAHTLTPRWELQGGAGPFSPLEAIWSLVTMQVKVAAGATDVIPGPPPPPPPPPPVTPPVSFTASASTISLGQSYTLTAVIDESQDTVHNVTIDGVSWASLGCTASGTTITCQLTRTPAATGSVTDTFVALNGATGTNFAPLTVTVQVQ